MTARPSPAPPTTPFPRVHHIEEVMGTAVVIDVYKDTGAVDSSDSIRRACALLHRVDADFSTWRPDSPMSRLRRGEIQLVDTPPEMREVLDTCASLREATNGWFDPWAMPGGVDPSGYVKGWAAGRAAVQLQIEGVIGAVVNAAGDIVCWGRHAVDQPFRFGIVDPIDRRRLCCTVDLSCGAIATSGAYERGAHLVDPTSGTPRARLASASVCGPDLGTADALATALVVCGPSGLRFVEALGYEALAITPSGAWETTEGFPIAWVDRHAPSRARRDPGHSASTRILTPRPQPTTVIVPSQR